MSQNKFTQANSSTSPCSDINVANQDDREALNAIDPLAFSMAAAELKVFDDDNREFIETWKAIFSSNLRTLVSEQMN